MSQEMLLPWQIDDQLGSVSAGLCLLATAATARSQSLRINSLGTGRCFEMCSSMLRSSGRFDPSRDQPTPCI